MARKYLPLSGDDTTLFVSNISGGKIYAYWRSNKAPNTARHITWCCGNSRAMGIWSDGDTMWASDQDDDKLYTYPLPDFVPPPDTLSVETVTDTMAVGQDRHYSAGSRLRHERAGGVAEGPRQPIQCNHVRASRRRLRPFPVDVLAPGNPVHGDSELRGDNEVRPGRLGPRGLPHRLCPGWPVSRPPA